MLRTLRSVCSLWFPKLPITANPVVATAVSEGEALAPASRPIVVALRTSLAVATSISISSSRAFDPPTSQRSLVAALCSPSRGIVRWLRAALPSDKAGVGSVAKCTHRGGLVFRRESCGCGPSGVEMVARGGSYAAALIVAVGKLATRAGRTCGWTRIRPMIS